ncbi:MAG: RsmE family RNA methyltransferase [Bacilli bacterium]
MQRYFLDGNSTALDVPALVGANYHHAIRVLRMQPGDALEVVRDGKAYRATLERIDGERAHLTIGAEIAASPEPVMPLILLQALPKGDKIDLILRQTCEIGVSRIIVYAGARSVAALPAGKRAERAVRWNRIAREAAELAHRTLSPEVLIADSLDDACASLEAGTRLLAPYESQTAALPSLKQVLQERVGHPAGAGGAVAPIAFAIGPEGGFADAEVALLRQRGAALLTLGPRIFRTETAGVVVAAAVLYELDQLGGVQTERLANGGLSHSGL